MDNREGSVRHTLAGANICWRPTVCPVLHLDFILCELVLRGGSENGIPEWQRNLKFCIIYHYSVSVI